MSAAPKVSVVVCAYNAQKYLSETIESVLAQTFRDFELVIVDDGSTDGTEALVRSYLGRGPIVYHKQANAGFGAARNKAVELARAEWIAIIDHDDVCLPERLERQYEAASRHPEAGLIFSNSEYFLDDGSIFRRQFDSFDPCGSDLGPGKAAELLLIEDCFVDSETAFFRKAEALAAGGFPTEYRYVNDYEFFLRMGARSAFVALPDVLSRWRVHPGQLSHTASDTMVREHIALLSHWTKDGRLSARSRRIASLRLGAYLARALRRPALRAEFGAASLAARAAGLLAEGALEPGWLLGRLRKKLGWR